MGSYEELPSIILTLVDVYFALVVCLLNTWCFLQTLIGSLNLRNQVTTQERRATELSAANAQLQKTLGAARTREMELKTEVATLQTDLLAAHTRETTFQTSLDEVKRENVVQLTQLETILGDCILAARAEIMLEFKDRKSRESNPDYWICLAQGKDVEEEPAALVDEDRVVQGQEETAVATIDASVTTEVINQPVGTDPIIE